MTTATPSSIDIQTVVQRQLAESFAEISAHLKQTPLAHRIGSLDRFQKISMAGQRYFADCYAYYFQLVVALFDEDWDAAQHWLALLDEVAPAAPEIEVIGLDDPKLANCRDSFIRLMDTDPLNSFPIVGASPLNIARFKETFSQAMALLTEHLPYYANQLQQLVTQIVCVEPAPGEENSGFGGGSSLMLWGAMFINVGMEKTLYEWIDTLVHESSHLLLFGLCSERPALLNEPDELFQSPLRTELRPMEGIFHAMFVSFHVCRAFGILSQSTAFDEADRELFAVKVSTYHNVVADCLTTIEEHAKLTETGLALVVDIKQNLAV